ncbi:bioflm peroxide resistance protein BsmA [Erwinia sp. OLTSP20]|uniref:biofilm peroxide resistance protein BsmA n=1 Tax=unclassified Erwinia TaxID=2622719 RepID=UPI000C198870|nr:MULTISPECIES: biofilm peroxide resistance protein BsmA [unclassified Erwinia]PIJ52062.1 bioflm peroxide resistance protein BsmA [Erwinia sp. OAMSP11]PIJ75225.1 bioflm peroxide resistance protein BsmA [Erwinia sp. OLSSP12]PIJ84432.1 bioflm peroxide resistance protein BsmA [Erwinia sp. OLCASP19]PIJ87046.1 bioflm peroxide resistance protein BsmA [Erwinia sp. OLMTSP26]PIJ88610.1 bioflm peroxide resistance protein BsmA [Erwinia sp. OLMDSP33]
MRTSLLLLLLLSGCSAFKSTPQPPPPPAASAQEINKAQRFNLPVLGNDSVTVSGSPDDALRAIKARANAVHATYYLILALDETLRPGFWYATAKFYGPPPSTAAGTAE